jgi:NAD-dependent SIR2 family protein deacetylase
MDINNLSLARAALADADILFVFTGAGCSKDSGLPVFNEVPGYQDLCSPVALAQQPEAFYNFFRSAASR